ncbi:MAG: nucleotidyltransferase family protein [Desulfuromonadales bacterium]|nr:nucleotidyltransferase family protein [Desulfuromonadales bacterium]
MGKQEIVDIIRSSKPELIARYGVARVGLFGSYVRGKQRKRSDIDILVSFSRDIDLFEFVELREYLQERLHSKVDLVMASALKPAIGRRILAEVEYV